MRPLDTVFGGLKRILAEISSLGYLTQLVEKEVLTGNTKPRDIGVGVGVDKGVDVGVDVGVGLGVGLDADVGLGIDRRGLGSDDVGASFITTTSISEGVGASAYLNGGAGLTD